MFYAVALPWLLLSTGHTAQELGIVLAAYGIPRVGTLLLGGILSDRLGPRRIMLFSDATRALLVGLIVLLVVLNAAAIWQLSIVAALLGACTGLFLPAYYTLTPEILPAESLQAGNALNTFTLQLALFAGAGLAGAVVSCLNPSVALLVDAGTFVVSAITLFLMGDNRLSTHAPDQALATVKPAEPTRAEDTTVTAVKATEPTGAEMGNIYRLERQNRHGSQ
jgi:MFS family permease